MITRRGGDTMCIERVKDRNFAKCVTIHTNRELPHKNLSHLNCCNAHSTKVYAHSTKAEKLLLKPVSLNL